MQQLFTEHFSDWPKILEPKINLLCWQRELDDATLGYAQQLLAHGFHVKQSLAGTQPQLWKESLASVLPPGDGKSAFLNDLLQLAEAFCLLTDSQGIGVRIRSLTQPMCPRWHVDHVPLRLVTAYVGCGSEWHTAEGQADEDCAHQINTGWVSLLKGSNWPDTQSRAIWHRSPRSDAPRLLCTLDAL